MSYCVKTVKGTCHLARATCSGRQRSEAPVVSYGEKGIGLVSKKDRVLVRCTPLCILCGRLDDLISEPTRAVGATVTAGL